ncbi:hypothetical protein [Staphylococcus epidermidis]|uniref:hypothetical protein n=1 Tax=Staphylococcus epidermidis TaxID=1282 RepID=UPI003713BD79
MKAHYIYQSNKNIKEGTVRISNGESTLSDGKETKQMPTDTTMPKMVMGLY